MLLNRVGSLGCCLTVGATMSVDLALEIIKSKKKFQTADQTVLLGRKTSIRLIL